MGFCSFPKKCMLAFLLALQLLAPMSEGAPVRSSSYHCQVSGCTFNTRTLTWMARHTKRWKGQCGSAPLFNRPRGVFPPAAEAAPVEAAPGPACGCSGKHASSQPDTVHSAVPAVTRYGVVVLFCVLPWSTRGIPFSNPFHPVTRVWWQYMPDQRSSTYFQGRSGKFGIPPRSSQSTN